MSSRCAKRSSVVDEQRGARSHSFIRDDSIAQELAADSHSFELDVS